MQEMSSNLGLFFGGLARRRVINKLAAIGRILFSS
jgi:hypothetical protein